MKYFKITILRLAINSIILFFIISCSKRKENNIVDYDFLCNYLNNNKAIDIRKVRPIIFNDSLYEKGTDDIKDKIKSTPLIVHLWSDTIDIKSFNNLQSILDSLRINYDNVLNIDKEKILNSFCNEFNIKKLDVLPKKNFENKDFFINPSASIIVQLSDLYINDEEKYGVIHFVYTTGFLDNTFSDIIYMEKENSNWVLME